MRIVLFQNSTSKALEQMLNKVSQGVPNFITALFIVIVGIIIAKIVARIVRKLLEKVKIDQVGQKLNEIDFVEKSNIEIKLSAILSKVIYYFIVLFALVAGTDVLNMPAISNMVVNFMEFIPNLIVALVLIIVGLLGADILRKMVKTTCDSLGIPTAKMISSAIFYFVFITVLVMALSQAGIQTEFLSQNISIIIGGAVLAFSVGYGLASKDTAANILASSYAKDKLSIGDVVSIDGSKGTIIAMDRSTVTLKSDDKKVILPLQTLVKNKLEIFS